MLHYRKQNKVTRLPIAVLKYYNPDLPFRFRYTIVRGRSVPLRHTLQFPRALSILDGHDEKV